MSEENADRQLKARQRIRAAVAELNVALADGANVSLRPILEPDVIFGAPEYWNKVEIVKWWIHEPRIDR